MPVGAPPAEGPGDRPARESRERTSLMAPPRAAVPVPGAPTAFGRGFIGRFRASQGGCFFLLFLGAGAGIFLFGLAGTVGPFVEGLRANGDPRFFLAAMAFGTVFFLVALRMLQITLTGTEHAKRGRKGVGAKEPWTVDYPWRPEGMGPDYESPGGGRVLGHVAFFTLIGLFNIALGSGHWLLIGIILFFDLLALAILVDVLRKIVQNLRRVGPRVRWTTFPAFLGARLEGVFTTRRRLAVAGPVRMILRCVEDVACHSQERGEQLEPYVIYIQAGEFPVPDRRLEAVPFAFQLPDDLPGTNLLRREAVYWQVVVEVPLTGPDFETVFLAPVYARRE